MKSAAMVQIFSKNSTDLKQMAKSTTANASIRNVSIMRYVLRLDARGIYLLDVIGFERGRE